MQNANYQNLPVVQNDNIVIVTQAEYNQWLESEEGKTVRETNKNTKLCLYQN